MKLKSFTLIKRFLPAVLIVSAAFLAGRIVYQNYDKSTPPVSREITPRSINDNPSPNSEGLQRNSPNQRNLTELIAIREELDRAPVARRLIILDQLGKGMLNAIRQSSGGIGRSFEVLEGMAANDQKHLLRLWILEAKSPEGGAVDFEEKAEGLRRLGYDESTNIYDKLIYFAGKNDPLEIVARSQALGLNDDEVAKIISAATTGLGAVSALECIDSLASDEVKVATFSKCSDVMLRSDPEAVTKWILEIQFQTLRNEYITVASEWLRSKGDTASASYLESQRK